MTNLSKTKSKKKNWLYMYHHDDHFHGEYSLHTYVYWQEVVPSEHPYVDRVGFVPLSPPLPFNSVLQLDPATHLRSEMC